MFFPFFDALLVVFGPFFCSSAGADCFADGSVFLSVLFVAAVAAVHSSYSNPLRCRRRLRPGVMTYVPTRFFAGPLRVDVFGDPFAGPPATFLPVRQRRAA